MHAYIRHGGVDGDAGSDVGEMRGRNELRENTGKTGGSCRGLGAMPGSQGIADHHPDCIRYVQCESGASWVSLILDEY